MKIFYTHKAEKQFRSLPRLIKKRIADKMRFFAAQNDPLKFAKHLTDYNEGEFRFRVGDYRLIFDVENKTIFIIKIEKRDKAYD